MSTKRYSNHQMRMTATDALAVVAATTSGSLVGLPTNACCSLSCTVKEWRLLLLWFDFVWWLTLIKCKDQWCSACCAGVKHVCPDSVNEYWCTTHVLAFLPNLWQCEGCWTSILFLPPSAWLHGMSGRSSSSRSEVHFAVVKMLFPGNRAPIKFAAWMMWIAVNVWWTCSSHAERSWMDFRFLATAKNQMFLLKFPGSAYYRPPFMLKLKSWSWPTQ